MFSLVALLVTFADATPIANKARDFVTPTRKLSIDEYPYFSDDKQLAGMEDAIERQLKRFQTKDLTGRISLGGKFYPLKRTVSSLKVFKSFIQEHKDCVQQKPESLCLKTFNENVKKHFYVFAPDLTPKDPRYGDKKTAFFTGYHTVPLKARNRPSTDFPHPVYKNPKDSRLLKTRHEIDFRSALTGKNLELLYAPSLFDLYQMHIEGGGYVTLEENGKFDHFFLSFDGTNKKKWNWISKYMMEKGYISNLSMAAQRKFLRANPQLHEEIFSTCPSYVFFKITRQPPQGADLAPLTDGRSIATDIDLYRFKGLLAYIEGERPEELETYDFEEEDVNNVKFKPFSRFFLDQDTGGAIKGKARADIYWGKDEYAYWAATFASHPGNIYFLLSTGGPYPN